MSVNLSTDNANNLFLGLGDALMHVISHLETPEDLQNTALTCKKLQGIVTGSLKIRAFEYGEAINELVNFAELFDREIVRVTEENESLLGETDTTHGSYHKFKFNAEKWRATAENILGFEGMKAEKLAEECRLDLIEALAEYNSVSGEKKQYSGMTAQVSKMEDRPISKIDISNIQGGLSEEQIGRINAVLETAKGTLKGDFFISKANCVSDRPILFEAGTKVDYWTEIPEIEGIFYQVWLTNEENENWHNHYYPRHVGGQHLSFDHLVGKREGDRIIIPRGAEGTGDEQVILRGRQSQYRDNDSSLEEKIVGPFVRQSCLRTSQFPKDELRRVQDAYTQEFLSSISGM